jgi:hypothetical protein
MRVTYMKSMQGGRSPYLRTVAISHSAGGSAFDDLRERAIDAVTWFALVAMVVTLYAVMLVALYRWSVYAPIFPPESGAAAEEAIPWP